MPVIATAPGPVFHALADFLLVENRLPIVTGRFAESDEALRVRITRVLFTLQAANPEACRFSLVIRAERPIVPDGVIRAAQQALSQVVAAGNRGVVKRPTDHGLQLKIALVSRPRADRLRSRQLARRAASQSVKGSALGGAFLGTALAFSVTGVPPVTVAGSSAGSG